MVLVLLTVLGGGNLDDDADRLGGSSSIVFIAKGAIAEGPNALRPRTAVDDLDRVGSIRTAVGAFVE